MIVRNVRSLTAGLAVATLLLLAGCSVSPPEELTAAVDELPGQLEDARKAVNDAEEDFEAKLDTAKYRFMQPYSEEERHVDLFGQARTKLDEASNVFEEEVMPLVDEYDEAKQQDLEDAVAEVTTLKDAALELKGEPSVWADQVLATQGDPDGTVEAAVATMEGFDADHEALAASIVGYKEAYDFNADAIDAKYEPLSTLHGDAVVANQLLGEEATKSLPNYAIMTTQAVIVRDNAAAFTEGAGVFKQLDDRETQLLIDMRVDSTVWITRTSWDDYYDFPTETDYDYSGRSVDFATANHFADLGSDKELASHWYGSFSVSIDEGQWNKLDIDPEEGMPSGDNTSGFYAEIEDTYCHKLKVFKNGEPDLSGRPAEADNYCSRYDTPEELEEGIYWIEEDSLSDAIGMDIYSKGVGYFEDQATTEATPPGMAYVGDPTTGEWATDTNGNDYWLFNNTYLFLLPMIGDANHHYRSDYDAWNRDCRYPANTACYGSFNGLPLYGLNSPLVDTRFPNSTYVSSGLHNATLRGAGPAARGGGPGGGGK